MIRVKALRITVRTGPLDWMTQHAKPIGHICLPEDTVATAGSPILWKDRARELLSLPSALTPG